MLVLKIVYPSRCRLSASLFHPLVVNTCSSLPQKALVDTHRLLSVVIALFTPEPWCGKPSLARFCLFVLALLAYRIPDQPVFPTHEGLR